MKTLPVATSCHNPSLDLSHGESIDGDKLLQQHTAMMGRGLLCPPGPPRVIVKSELDVQEICWVGGTLMRTEREGGAGRESLRLMQV